MKIYQQDNNILVSPKANRDSCWTVFQNVSPPRFPAKQEEKGGKKKTNIFINLLISGTFTDSYTGTNS